MYYKIHPPQYYGGNTDSCVGLVEYLEKENEGKAFEEGTFFFSHEADYHTPTKVRQSIDGNVKKLGQQEARFYMMTLNPSPEELAHIQKSNGQNYTEALKSYTRAVMEAYAAHFNRTYKDGTALSGKDLVYFAKIEQLRSYKPWEKDYQEIYAHNQTIRKEIYQLTCQETSQKVKAKIAKLEAQYIRNPEGTIILPGQAKDGLHTHIHLIISRKDKKQELKLSPMAASKGSENTLNGKTTKIGFNREAFAEKVQSIFDVQFGYKRSLHESYQYYKARKHSPIKYLNYLTHFPAPEYLLRQAVLEAVKQLIKENKTLEQMLYFPKSTAGMRDKVVGKTVNLILKGITGPKAAMGTPVTITAQLLKNIIQKALKMTLQSSGISF
ncbi:MAG: hypothetical protein KTR26_01635 [Flammeovirgaceae bacterium]|nr:hypothetical protein [Flammeovirgaceae bacterium]